MYLSDLPAVNVLPVKVGDVLGVKLGVAGRGSTGHESGLGWPHQAHLGPGHGPQGGRGDLGDSAKHGVTASLCNTNGQQSNEISGYLFKCSLSIAMEMSNDYVKLCRILTHDLF